uniref:Dolichyl-diphosphooligosaccharide-protein glycosyltransferase subunit OST5 n=1 Tax=Aegilops tauschii subsp. strangulata TaxID=200361 RepID=A0A453SCU9_AEGTS
QAHNNLTSNLVHFSYEATTSRRNRSLTKEIVTASIASVFLGFGSLFVLLASGVYV